MAAKHPVDVAVLTVIPAELEAALEALGIPEDEREKAEDGTVYFRGTIGSELRRRGYEVVLGCIGAAGNPGAAAATQAVIDRYAPRAVLLMGIAAGLRGKVRIGGVVLSDRVVAYEPAALVRAASGASQVQPRPEIDRTPHAMNQDVVSYRPDRRRLGKIFARIGGVFPKAPADREEDWRRHVARAIEVGIGTIASGEKLLRDPAKLVEARELHGKVEVGEMEAAGLVEACRRANVPWLVVRGISDFGDELKDDRFHRFASRAAAAVLLDFLAQGLDLGGGGGGATLGFTAKHGFVFGRPIDRDRDFVGRKAERDMILEAIDGRQPVQILGESMMGKTSLLQWVKRHTPPDRPVVWVDPTRGVSPASLVLSIARALGKEDAAASLARADATADEAARVLDALVPFVLLIDDADALAALGRGFDEGFFGALRGLMEQSQLTWVSASQRNLYDLFKKKGLTSKFLNGARKVWVGPLDGDSARELAVGVGREETAALLCEAGGFAHGLQWLGDRVQRRPGAIERACDAFRSEMESVFERWWEGLTAEEKQGMQACAKEEGVEVKGLEEDVRRRLRRLEERGLLAEEEGRFRVRGEGWRRYVGYGG